MPASLRQRRRDVRAACAGDGPTAEGTNYWFDLNRAQHEEQWRRNLPEYDVVVLAEVIEHLHTAPTLVLRFLRTLVAEGGVLVVQTPTALSLHKRAKVLVGRHPYGPTSTTGGWLRCTADPTTGS